MRISLIAASLLAGTTPIASAPLMAGDMPQASAAKPQFGTYGFDTGGVDPKVAPGDDFYAHANGNWARTTKIPADRASWGEFSRLDELSRERTRGILEAAKADPASRIGVAYAAYLDQATIDAKGLAPIRPWLDEIKALSSKAGYAELVARAERVGIGTPIATFVNQDDKQPEQYALTITQSGLGMPDRDYYLSDDAKLVEARTAYEAHLTRMLTLAGEGDAAARAKAVVAFETEIARTHWTQVDNRDADRTYNKMTVAQLQATAPGFDFARFLKRLGAKVRSVIVAQPSAIAGEAKLIGDAPLAVVKDQLLLRSLGQFADVLPGKFDQENFAFNGTVLSGTPEQQVRWKRGVDFTSAALSDDVSKLYVAQYFPPATKAAADELVQGVIAAMGRRIDKLDWMSAETKAKAHAKLAAFTPKIGYPDRWRDYSALKIQGSDAFGNNWRANEWQTNYQLSRLGKPIQRWEWGMTPMTVNAYANFGMVEIVFPAAILQPPFFDPNADPAVNYGGIGAVIGHELSHHFDDQGAKYDATGRLTQWWTDADVAAFKQRTDALVKQYDAYEPLPGMHVKGALTLGENVADLAGLSVAHDAYLASLGGKPAPVIDGTTGDQRFYYGWAQVWRRSYREANLRQRLLTDPHSPSEQRAAVVRNLDPWYGAFPVKPGQKLYLTPKQRVRIW